MSNNKLAKLRRQASQVLFASNSFGPIERFMLYALGFEYVGHLVGYLYVDHHVQLHVGQFFLAATMLATMSATLSITLSTSILATNYPIPKNILCWGLRWWGALLDGKGSWPEREWWGGGWLGRSRNRWSAIAFLSPPPLFWRIRRREDSLGIIIRLDTHRQQHLRCLYCHLSPDRQCIMYCSANVLQRDCICRTVHEHTCRIITWLYLGVVRLYIVRFPDLLW